jgi:hypothetical protein
MRLPVRRAYTYAKIHGIFSRCNSIDDLLGALSARNAHGALSRLGWPTPTTDSEDAPEEEREYRLNQGFLTLIGRLIPGEGPGGRLFTALLAEFEARNISLYLKRRPAELPRYYRLPDGLGLCDARNFLLPEPRVLGLLARTRYADAITAFLKDHQTALLDARLETLCKAEQDAASLALPGRDRRIIRPLIVKSLELSALVSALRLCKGYHLDPETALKTVHLPRRSFASGLRSLLGEQHFDQPQLMFPREYRAAAERVLALRPDLSGADFDPQPGFSELAMVERIARLILHGTHRHGLTRNLLSLGPLYCFCGLLRDEIDNLVLLINGIRFDVSRQFLKTELVY